MNSPARTIAATHTDSNLFHVARAIESDLLVAFASGVKMTQAHIGQIELMTACTDELVARGYHHGVKADGSDLPVDVNREDGIRYSITIRVF